MELPKPAPGQAGVLQDIDVLFLTPVGDVQLVEVKRSGQALWMELNKTKEGRYLDKFADWRASGDAIGQNRRLAFAIRHADDGWLEKPLTTMDEAPSSLLDTYQIDVRRVAER